MCIFSIIKKKKLGKRLYLEPFFRSFICKVVFSGSFVYLVIISGLKVQSGVIHINVKIG